MSAPIGKLNAENRKKILKGAGIVVAGSLLAYVAELLPGVDLGAYTGIAVGIGSILINFLRELLKDESGKVLGNAHL